MSKLLNVLKKAGMFAAVLLAGTVLSSESVQAAPAGIYIADCTPHYRHPQTGVIEDAGGEESFALGQSMTEGATAPTALVEVDEFGNTYITIRLCLMDNINNVSFLIDGGQADPVLIKEDPVNHTADYRMLVFSEDSVITTSLYVAPMGRDVRYFITVGNLQPGSGDFSPQISLPQTASEEPAAEAAPEPSVETAPESSVEITPEPSVETTPEPSVETTPEPSVETTPESSSQTAPSSAIEQEGLQEFDEQGSPVKEQESEKTVESKKDKEKTSPAVWAGIAAAVIVIAGGIWYFLVYKKKK